MPVRSNEAKDHRQRRIRELVAGQGSLSVEQLSGLLEVTGMTIRRDLDEMQDAGLLLRVHGGARLASPFVQEQSFSEKAELHPAEKRVIALKAATLLSPGMSVYLDTGTTTALVAQLLPAGLDLQVHTNNLRAVMDLIGRRDLTVHVFGGRLAAKNPDLAGPDALARIPEVRTDLAFLGADAVDPVTGEVFAADEETAAVSRLARRQAGRSFVLADSAKVGGRGLHVTGRIGPDLGLVTDAALPPALRRTMEKTGAEILLAAVTRTETLLKGAS